MKELWDSSTAGRLRAAIRRHSPDDWRASRALIRAKRLGLTSAVGALSSVWALVVGVGLVCSPLFVNTEMTMQMPAAFGVVALYVFAMGTALGAMVLVEGNVEVLPLAYAPVGGAFVYHYALAVVRRRAVRKGISGLLMLWGVTLAITLSHLPSSWLAVLRATAGMVLLAGPSCLLGTMKIYPWKIITRTILAVFSIAFVAFLMQALHLKLPFIPQPAAIGRAMLVLPQADVLIWLAGGPLSWASIVFSLGTLVLVLQLIHRRFRNRDLEIEPDADALRPTAEFIAAKALKQWRQQGENARWHTTSRDEEEEPEEEEDDELVPFSDADQPESLLTHPAAPAEHSAPVEPAFREAIAHNVRHVLDQAGENAVTAAYLNFPRGAFPPLPRLFRVAACWGVVLPLLCLVPPCLPLKAQLWIGESWALAAFIMLVMPLAFRTRPNLLLTSLQTQGFRIGVIPWASLPLDVAHQVDLFRQWSRKSSQRLMLLAATAMLGVIASTLVFITVSHWLGHRSGYIVFAGSDLGVRPFAAEVALVLAGEILILRGLETGTFTQELFRHLRLLRLWRLVTKVLCVLVLLQVAGYITAACLLGQSLFGDGKPAPWAWAWPVVAFGAGELFRQATLWLMVYVARRARADFVV